MTTDPVFEKTLRLARPARTVFSWLQGKGVLERLTPPWERLSVVHSDESVRDGARVKIRMKVGPLSIDWEALHSDYVEDVQFRDTQVSGPFSKWTHLHRVESDSACESRMIDRVEYRLPVAALAEPVFGGFVRRRLERLFTYRHSVTRADQEAMARYGAVRSLRVLVAGGSGLIGRALVPFLKSQGHEVITLVRREAKGPDEVSWNPDTGTLDPHALRGVDAVVNLAGENIAASRWTAARKAALANSRIRAADTLNRAIGAMKHRPFVLVSASAIGAYGDRGDERLLEDSRPGIGFLPDLCRDWEQMSAGAEEFGLRTVQLRFGVVLTPAGGVLGQMLPFARCCLPTVFGNGRQWLSWISIDDALGAIHHALLDQRCSGPVNAVAPTPVPLKDFGRVLGRVLRRPSFLKCPGWIFALVTGEMGEALVLSSARVFPGTLVRSGYVFRHETVESALRHLLGRAWSGEPQGSSRQARRRGR